MRGLVPQHIMQLWTTHSQKDKEEKRKALAVRVPVQTRIKHFAAHFM